MSVRDLYSYHHHYHSPSTGQGEIFSPPLGPIGLQSAMMKVIAIKKRERERGGGGGCLQIVLLFIMFFFNQLFLDLVEQFSMWVV